MTNESIRTLDDLPVPVGNSQLLAIGFDLRDAFVAYHVHEETNDGVIRVLGMDTEEIPCATVVFRLPVATRIDTWDGDADVRHSLGIERGCIYEVVSSRWLDDVQRYENKLYQTDRLRHFIFAFRVRILHVAAVSYSVSVTRRSLAAAMACPWASDRL